MHIALHYTSYRNVSDANLRFLTPEQALADIAHFINHLRRLLPGASNSEVILVGGHYSASLAVWHRQRYPHLTTGKKFFPKFVRCGEDN